MRIALASFAMFLLAGCSKAGNLQPASIVMPQAWVGFRSHLLLSFTLNGQPVDNPAISLASDVDPAFGLVPPGPLGTKAQLTITPQATGPLHTTLHVTAGGEAFDVPVSAVAQTPPDCGKPATPCQTPIFDPDQGRCTSFNSSEGRPCGTNDCSTASTCVNGMCVARPKTAVAPDCDSGPTASLPLLAPVWSYEPQAPLWDRSVFDEAGNLYFLECAPPSYADCDLVSIDLDGQPRWRNSDAFNAQAALNQAGALMAAGSYVIAVNIDATAPIRAWTQAEGASAWVESTDEMAALTALTVTGTRLVAMFEPWELRTYDLVSGTMLSSFPLASIVPIGTLAGDGTSTAWTLSQTEVPFGAPTAAGQPMIPVAVPASIELDTGMITPSDLNSDRVEPASNPTIVAALNGLVITPQGAWMGTKPVAGFPPQAAASLTDAVIGADGTSIALMSEADPDCSALLLGGFDASQQQQFLCRLPEHAAPWALSLTADGGVVVGLFTANDEALVAVYDRRGRLEYVGKLQLHDEQAVISSATLIGNRWIVTESNGSTGVRIEAFDLPIGPAADSGWTQHAGGPGGTWSGR